MDRLTPFTRFMAGIAGDARIGTTHIALFMALFDLWLKNGKTESLNIQPMQAMKRAKILSRSTYVRVIRDLHDGGYLIYDPSFSNKRRSRVRFK